MSPKPLTVISTHEDDEVVTTAMRIPMPEPPKPFSEIEEEVQDTKHKEHPLES